MTSFVSGKTVRSHMYAFRHVSFNALIVSAIAVPIWIAVGRAFFGIGGWAMIATVLFYGPVLLVFHVLCIIIVRNDTENWNAKQLPLGSACLLVVYLLFVVVFQVSVVDGGDASTASVLTQLLGGVVTDETSGNICTWSYRGMITAGIMLMFSLFYSLNRSLRQQIARADMSERGKAMQRLRKWHVCEGLIVVCLICAGIKYGVDAYAQYRYETYYQYQQQAR